jgi:hypothetical protein
MKMSSTYSHTWLGFNPQTERPLSRIIGAIGLFFIFQVSALLSSSAKKKKNQKF